MNKYEDAKNKYEAAKASEASESAPKRETEASKASKSAPKPDTVAWSFTKLAETFLAKQNELNNRSRV